MLSHSWGCLWTRSLWAIVSSLPAFCINSHSRFLFSAFQGAHFLAALTLKPYNIIMLKLTMGECLKRCYVRTKFRPNPWGSGIFWVDLTWNDPHPKRDCHHTYAHPENRSFIHRFALICSAIIIYHGAEADVRHWQVYIMLFVFLEVLCVSPLSKVGLNHESCGRMDG